MKIYRHIIINLKTHKHISKYASVKTRNTYAHINIKDCITIIQYSKENQTFSTAVCR